MFDHLFDRDRLTGYVALAVTVAIVIVALPFLAAVGLLATALFAVLFAAVILHRLGRASAQHAMTFGAAVLLIAGVGVAMLAVYPAFAQSTTTTPTGMAQQLINEACANNGALLTKLVAWIGGVIGGFSLIANFRSKIPAPIMKVVDVIALNWVKSEAAAAASPQSK